MDGTTSSTDQKTGQQMVRRVWNGCCTQQSSKEFQIVEGRQNDSGRETKYLDHEWFQSPGIVGVSGRLDQDD